MNYISSHPDAKAREAQLTAMQQRTEGEIHQTAATQSDQDNQTTASSHNIQ